MQVAGFAARRLGTMAVTLLVSSFVIFAALYAAPGNPLATLSGGRTLTPESIAALEARYRLDEPFFVQYGNWLISALGGDLGESIALNDGVAAIIAGRVGITLQLVLMATVLIVVVGVGAGALAGLRRGRWDTLVLAATTLGAAVPSFVAASALVGVFAVGLGWFPALGPGEGLAPRTWHLMLPAVALAMSATAIVARVTRVSVRAELAQEHVQTAISRGIPYGLVVRRHVLRNAAIPITTVAGVTVASLIALAAVVERAFSLNGLGSALVQAAASKDIALVQGIALVLVATFVAINAAVDLLYATFDPRISLGTSAA